MWEVRMSNSRGVAYYFDPETKASTWEAPPGLTEEEISQLPGAEYLKGGGKQNTDAHAGQVKASHLLIKHSGSRRPSSWKEDKITRSKEEAIQILQEFQAEINGDAETFARLAQEHSDCSSHTNGGDLGYFKRGQMQKPFEDATFALEPGHMSDIISTDSGVHIILRTA